MISLGPNKGKIMAMIFLSSTLGKNYTFQFLRGNLDHQLHRFRIFQVGLQLSKYEMSQYVCVAVKLN